MNLKCSKCHQTFNGSIGLIKHIRKDHLDFISSFVCGQEGCARQYQNLDSFRKHLKKIHESNVCSASVIENTNDVIFESNYNEISCGNIEENMLSDTNTNELNTETFNKSDIFEMMDKIKRSALMFVMNLHNKASITRSQVLFITNDVTKFLFENVSNLLKRFIVPDISIDLTNTLDIILNFMNSPFEEFQTEYKLMSYLEKNDLYRKPKEYLVDSSNLVQNVNETSSKVVLTDVKFNFSKFLGTNNMLARITDYMKDLENTEHSEILKNFLHGKIWRKKRQQYAGRLLIPYLIYADDFEINNPLGSQAGKHTIAGTYSQILCLPPDVSSSLDCIIPLMFFRTMEKKTNHSGLNINHILYHKLIEQLNDMEINGIDVKQSNGNFIKVHLIIGLINGDNLGLNEILGFTTSFNATYCCRICQIDKLQRQISTRNLPELKRTEANYQADVEALSTGVNEECVFNRITSFNVIDNTVVDEMHDFLEGNAHYVMCKIILDFIQKNYFTLEYLNQKVQHFKYAFNDRKNVPPIITLGHLTRNKLKTSAEQMLVFINYFVLYVDDKILSGDESYILYQTLIQISDLLMKFEISKSELILLETLIEEHHEMYIKLFKDTLKPKMHNMLHYKEVFVLLYLICFNIAYMLIF